MDLPVTPLPADIHAELLSYRAQSIREFARWLQRSVRFIVDGSLDDSIFDRILPEELAERMNLGGPFIEKAYDLALALRLDACCNFLQPYIGVPLSGRPAVGLLKTVEGRLSNEDCREIAIPPVSGKRKRSTGRGKARVKLIAALTLHHKYAEGGCLNTAPIVNNELARRVKVSTSTASTFFKKEFHGHKNYEIICADAKNLGAALKLLNDEFGPYNLLGSKSPAQGERDEDERDKE